VTPFTRRTVADASLCRWLLAFAFALSLAPGVAAGATEAATDPAKLEAASGESAASDALDPRRLFEAIVKVQTRAVPNARSAATLGEEREGTGIVIGEGGLILTIGYLIVEADEVKVQDSRGRTLPAKLVGYDHATGFGLVRTVAPMSARPIPLGESAKLAERAPVMIVNSDGPDDVTLAFVASRRQFSANWEYMIDGAIFTAPPALNWSGAALIDRDGKLMGVGSLVVRDAAGGERGLPGNMFVPIDLLKPVLADMIKTGRRAGPARPWLGVSADEQLGRLYVTRVSPDGPGEAAGLKPGDIILGVGGEGVRTQTEFYRKLWGQGAAGTDIRLRVLQGIDVKDMQVHSIDRVEYFRPQTTF
jgi:S1-C subfamily serine protease